jgi:hypothetical protein
VVLRDRHLEACAADPFGPQRGLVQRRVHDPDVDVARINDFSCSAVVSRRPGGSTSPPRTRPKGGAACRGWRDPTLTDDDHRAMFERCLNWGRWGDDDQAGTLNLITPEKRRRAARLVRSGRSGSFTRPLSKVRDTVNVRPLDHHMTTSAHNATSERTTGSASAATAWPTPTSTR